jgi:hypothetical protein
MAIGYGMAQGAIALIRKTRRPQCEFLKLDAFPALVFEAGRREAHIG